MPATSAAVGTMRSVSPDVGTVTTTGKRSASLGETSVGGGARSRSVGSSVGPTFGVRVGSKSEIRSPVGRRPRPAPAPGWRLASGVWRLPGPPARPKPSPRGPAAPPAQAARISSTDAPVALARASAERLTRASGTPMAAEAAARSLISTPAGRPPGWQGRLRRGQWQPDGFPAPASSGHESGGVFDPAADGGEVGPDRGGTR